MIEYLVRSGHVNTAPGKVSQREKRDWWIVLASASPLIVLVLYAVWSVDAGSHSFFFLFFLFFFRDIQVYWSSTARKFCSAPLLTYGSLPVQLNALRIQVEVGGWLRREQMLLVKILCARAIKTKAFFNQPFRGQPASQPAITLIFLLQN